VLSDRLAQLLPKDASVLDVGCGDGRVDHLITERRPDVTIRGVDVLVRPDALMPVEEFDGKHIPYDSNSVDVVMFVDVLHHTEDPLHLLREALRVASRSVVLKDHTCDGFLAAPTLRFMDWVGNAPHGVVLPYNYWAERQWQRAFESLGVTPNVWIKRLGLYPRPASWIFERNLHFIARIDVP
jgi:SAM-dependent methyltransferase